MGFVKLISREQLENNLFKITRHHFNNGRCQCFKDCDCYLKKGEFEYEEIKYSNGLINPITDKEQYYNTIQGAKQAYEWYLKQEIIG